MHAISSYRGNMVTDPHTNKHTHKQTHRQDRLQYTAPLSIACSVNVEGIAEETFSETFYPKRERDLLDVKQFSC